MTDQVQHLSAPLSLGEISTKTKAGARATLIAQVISVAIQMLGLLVLSRLLEPSDFGVFAVATSVLVLVQLLQNIGASAYLVQTQKLDEVQASTIFFLLLMCSIGAMALLLLAAPFLTRIFEYTHFQVVITVLALSLPLSALAVLPTSILQRNMFWSQVRVVTIAGQAAGVGAAIVFAAIFNAGVWALVAQVVSLTITGLFLSWYFCKWRPSWTFRPSSLNGFFGFGAMYTGTRIVHFFKQWFDKMVAGANFSPVETGNLARASSISQMPEAFLLTPIAQPMFSALSRLQSQPLVWRRYAVLWLQAMFLLSCFFATVMASAAEEIVWLLLGPQWDGAVDILFLLGVLFAVRGFATVIPSLLLSLGKSRQLFFWDFLTLPLVLAAVFLGGWYSVAIMLIFLIAANAIILAAAIFFLPRTTHLSSPDIVRSFFSIAIVSVCSVYFSTLFPYFSVGGGAISTVTGSVAVILSVSALYAALSVLAIYFDPGLKELKAFLGREAIKIYRAVIA